MPELDIQKMLKKSAQRVYTIKMADHKVIVTKLAQSFKEVSSVLYTKLQPFQLMSDGSVIVILGDTPRPGI